MEPYKCAFSNTLITKQFGCEKGEQVTRRGGPDIACASEEAHLRCEKLYQQMKAAALPAFGVEDDLLSMPHSVLVKIQLGGLLGLQRLLSSGAADSAEVRNIHALVDQAIGQYGNLDAIPCPALVEDMTSYKLKRRG
ncbi:MAG: hypothetical protein NUV55_09830 [Sulfuricaulis sp.]|uniref:hypothetical protein n=1 Tax=Sulfuricaulis sp. TaxID=2003553 RepID=UPI0025DB441F|nr:hypothetical protein [Sulfuricaulis sp.]MCR4347482.1 hypothetical protein [Sulfuricaulis sp.]